ncbi:hypothetical protein [Enterococcus rivorum]|uniref:Uncharacterized protein n=1 Tax=Enterococcus rivorum TaxID=762845 RepID=A0A1E5KWC7_9ENTE|nr:hypothetical protein [Enterococcus rivorum]MBP2099023.1 hypothetical protein [Enterococcus rivorum]OEH82172.1 hypothetical protein BCR26_13945 [Enterococcus rivorum]
MKDIHDYEIKRYSMDFVTNELVFKIEKNNNFKKIIFYKVFAYHFSDEMAYSVILDLEERNLDHFFKMNKKLLNDRKNYGWPIMYEDNDELRKKIEESHANYYLMRSSYGMGGWILAESVEIIDS